MKTKTLLSIAMVAMMAGAFAQKPSMTLTFTADSNGQHVPLNSILIENLSQGGDTTLYAPDTVLVLDYVTGIGENETNRDNAFIVTQNYPNPMQGKSTISLNMTENGHIFITVSDIMGRELIRQELRLNQGNHSFAFVPGKESLYFLTARVNHQSQTIKMINTPSRSYGSGTCSLEYSGEAKGTGAFKSKMFLTNFAFSLGDQLKFTALTDLGERVITSSPAGDQTYYFHYTGDPCLGAPTVTDIDGNVYNTIHIGNQCWMKENLKTTTYKNGTPIPNVTDGSAWSILTTGAYVWYDNDISWKDKYGTLYNWYAAVDPSGLCPTGWHIPSHNEWTALTDHIGGTGSPNGNKLKSCRQVNSSLGGSCNTSVHPRWEEDAWTGVYGTDDYGFSGLPGGGRGFDGGFYLLGYYGIWWSSTEVWLDNAWSLSLNNLYGGVTIGDGGDKHYGTCVRCLRDSPPSAAFIAEPTIGTAPLTVNFTDQSTNSPTSWQWSFGDGGTSTQQNPAHTYQNAGSYTVQLTVTNSYGSDTEIKTNYITVTSGGGTGVPCPGMPTVTDIDGNVYNTVLIGSQCWMKENLKTTTYKNGTLIPNVTNNSSWSNLTTGAYVWYDNDINWKDKYGALYNWYAVVDPNGLCPAGWHVPTDNELTALTTFIGGFSSPNGNKLKSCRQVNSPLGGDCNTSVHPRWEYYSASIYGTDDYGFSGLPGGYRSTSGAFYYVGGTGLWWSSMELSFSNAVYHALSYDYGNVGMFTNDKRNGFSIRCLRD